MLKNNRTRYSIGRHRTLLMGVLCLFGVCLIAGNRPAKDKKKKHNKKDMVYIINSDETIGDEVLRPNITLLQGNVKLRHKNMYMFCDSAYLNEKTNSFEAFGKVHMEQGDTLFIYGNYLKYDGYKELAKIRENVKLVNRGTTLLTDSLDYDRVLDKAYYFEGGTMLDKENVLTSDWGEYSPSTKNAVFNFDVKLVNPRFTLKTDTLKYNTGTSVAHIVGPSYIDSEKNHIFSKRGYYNTRADQAQLMDRSVLNTEDGKRLIGDSIYYDRKKGYGEAFYNVIMTDSLNKNFLKGDYCFYNELLGNALATRKALAVDYSQGDSLFLHGDTLKMNTFNMNTDSMYRELRAYHKARLFRKDIQGVCDSLFFSTKDTCLIMYKDPILWNENKQLLGEEIRVYMNDSTIDWAHIVNQALSIEKKDTIHYNQITGKEIKAFFVGGDMRKVDVIGNVRLVYYPEDKDSTMIGMNVSETSLLNIFIKEKKMQKMVMSPNSNGTLYPMLMIPPEKLRLENFGWFDYIRPLNKDDIFEWRGKKAGQELKNKGRKSIPLPNHGLLKK